MLNLLSQFLNYRFFFLFIQEKQGKKFSVTFLEQLSNGNVPLLTFQILDTISFIKGTSDKSFACKLSFSVCKTNISTLVV